MIASHIASDLDAFRRRLADLVAWHGDVPLPEIGGLKAAIRQLESEAEQQKQEKRYVSR